MVTRHDGFHHVDAWPSKDGILRGLYVDHMNSVMTYVDPHELGVRSCQANASRSRQTYISETGIDG